MLLFRLTARAGSRGPRRAREPVERESHHRGSEPLGLGFFWRVVPTTKQTAWLRCGRMPWELAALRCGVRVTSWMPSQRAQRQAAAHLALRKQSCGRIAASCSTRGATAHAHWALAVDSRSCRLRPAQAGASGRGEMPVQPPCPQAHGPHTGHSVAPRLPSMALGCTPAARTGQVGLRTCGFGRATPAVHSQLRWPRLCGAPPPRGQYQRWWQGRLDRRVGWGPRRMGGRCGWCGAAHCAPPTG